jgi:hypothetical protein
MKKLLFSLLLVLPLFSNISLAQSTSAKIVLCESYDDYGVASGINDSWVIKSTGGFVYILYNNGTAIKEDVYLFVDKKNSKGVYEEYATEPFDVEDKKKWCVFDYKFTEDGEYKISAANINDDILATTYCEINFKEEDKPKTTTTTSSNSSINKTSKSLVLCESHDTKGIPSGVSKTWNLKSGSGFVYALYNNGAKNINNKLWLYIDKLNTSGNYTPYDNKTFITLSTQSWCVYDYEFKESGDYKLTTVSSVGEEAVTYTTINFDGQKTSSTNSTTKKTIALCESYDDYGNVIGENKTWNINQDGGWVYILYNHGENITSQINLKVEKKSTSGSYVSYQNKNFVNDEIRSWSVYDFNFKEAGDYKISAEKNGTLLASTTATIKIKDDVKEEKEASSQDKVDTWYYDGSKVVFGDKANATGITQGESAVFKITNNLKEVAIVYSDSKPCKTTLIYVDIYEITEDGDEFLETIELPTLPTQKIISTSYKFTKEGSYKVSFYNADNTFMNLGTFEIEKSYSSTTQNTYNTNGSQSNNTKPIVPATTITTNNTYIDNSPRIALVIGNGNYDVAGTLPNPVHDAEEMSKALKLCGFDVTLILNGTKKQMNEAVNQFGQKLIAKKGTGLVYYAGHGIQSDGENYIIPVDAEITAEEDLQYECLNVGKILAKMEAAKNPINIIALDACRNNPFERSWNRSSGNSSGLVGMNAPEGTIISFSTNPGNTASDGVGYNSPYTTAFLNQLKKSGLTIEQVLKGVALEVKTSTPGQLPWYSSSITGEFFFK